jgi:predicted membrane protein
MELLQIVASTATTAEGYVFPNELHVNWGLMVVLYPYITGLVAGAFIVSSMHHVFHVASLRPLARLSLLFALAFLSCAALPLLIHLGHPERAMNIFLTPNPTSAMAGFGYLYVGYGLLLVLEIFFLYRPTLVQRARDATGFRRGFYQLLSMGSDNVSEAALRLDRKIVPILAGLGIPMACLLHGYVGFIFGGVKAVPLWATPLIPVIFLLSAIVSGMAAIVLTYFFLMKVAGRPIDFACMRTALRFLWAFFVIDVTFEFLEIFSHSYMATGHWDALRGLLWGPLYNSYWVWQVMILSAIPLGLLGYVVLTRAGDRIVRILAPLSATMILVQVLLMRWNVVIGGQLMSKSGRGTVYYNAEWLEREGILTSIAIMVIPIIVLYFLGKVLPFWPADHAPMTRGSRLSEAGEFDGIGTRDQDADVTPVIS